VAPPARQARPPRRTSSPRPRGRRGSQERPTVPFRMSRRTWERVHQLALSEGVSIQRLLFGAGQRLHAARTAADREWSDVRLEGGHLGGELIALAKQLDSPILALSSQSRAGGAYGRGDREAALDSFKESGDLEYSADVALFLTEAKERSATTPAVALDLTTGGLLSRC
jgi:DnaB-like helicase C terminal domain